MERGVWLTCLWLAALLVHAAEPPPPVAAYANLPEFDNVEISPDGQRLLMFRPKGESQHLTVVDLAAGSNRLVLASKPAEFLFNWCRWANDERIVCSVRAYVQRTAGNLPGVSAQFQQLTVTRLFAVNADGSNFLALVPLAVSRTGRDLQWNSQLQDRVISWLPEDREAILIQLDREKPLQPSVYRLDIYTNQLSRVLKHRAGVRAWYADHRGEVRLGVGFRDTMPMAMIRSGSRFAEVDISRFITDLPPSPRAFSPDGTSLYLEMFQEGKRGIYEVRLSDLAVVRPLLVDDAVDVYGALFTHDRTGALIGAVYQRDFPVIEWFDADAKALDQRVAKALPTPVRIPTSIDDARTRVVFSAESATTAPAFFLYDDKGARLTRIGSTYPLVPEQWIAPLQPFSYRARDGLEVPAYYAVPNGVKPKGLPTVVLPHGGPHARDTAGFDYWTEFFVSRGYAVVKPNFRGSIGYGADFLRGGYGEWGRKMQSDVIDGLDWMITEGITDPKRVCIVGGSYGGYAALVAAFQTPERFRCAVSFAGVADLVDLVAEQWKYDLGELTNARIRGDLSGKDLRAVSPLQNVDRMNVPLLIVHGDLDRTVSVEQSQRLVDALKSAGKPHIYIEQPGGDHFLSVRSHRLQLLEAMESFLATHLTSS